MEKEINGMTPIRNKVVEFMEATPIFERLTGEKWYAVEDALTDFLTNNFGIRWEIFEDVQRKNHIEDVKNELDEREMTATEEEIEHITDYYEDYLTEDDSWHTSLDLAFDRFEDIEGEDE